MENIRSLDANIEELGIDKFDEPPIEGKLMSLDRKESLLLFEIPANAVEKSPNKSIILSVGNNTEVVVKTTEKTVYELSEELDKSVYMLCNSHDELFVEAVFKSELYETLFIGKPLKTIRWFFNQSNKYRSDLIKRNTNSPKFPLADLGKETPMSIEDYECLFKVLRNTFDLNQQKHISWLLSNTKNVNSDTRAQILQKLDIMLTSSSAFDPNLVKIKPSVLKKLIREEFSGQDSAVDAIVEAITASYFSQKGPYLTLVGPPGVGKTFLARLVSKILGGHFYESNIETVSTQSEYSGTDSSFNQSKPGSIVTEKRKAGNDLSVFIFNELDKAIENENGSVKNLFATLISERKMEDSFLGCHIYMNDFIFFTANSLENIPSHVRNRINVIKFSSYSTEEKVEIARNHVIKDLLKKYKLTDREVVFKDNVIKYIVENFTVDFGIRETKKCLEAIFNKILAKFAEEEQREPVIVAKKFVDTVLKTRINKKSPAYIYSRNKQYYDEDVRTKIEEILTNLESTDIKEDKRKQMEAKLRCFVKLKYMHKSSSSFNFDKQYFFDCTNSLIGLNGIKQTLAEDFCMCSISNTKPSAILFSGSNGIGKTALAEEIANALRKPLVKVPCGTVTLKNDLSGYGDDWISPKPGLILDKITDIENSVILFDEIDKLGEWQNSYLGDVLIDLLNNGSFYEDYLNTFIDLSKCIIICSCNDPSAIKPVLRDRLTEIKFPNYTTKEKEAIIRSSLIPNLQKEIKKSISVEDSVIRTVCEFCTTSSIREVKKNLKKLVKRALFKDLDNVLLDEKLVEEVLGPIPNHKIPDDMMTSGCSIGVAVAGDGSTGTAFRIESTFIEDGKNDLIITGLAQETVRDSVQICLTLLKKKYPYAFNKSLHINFTPAAVKKEGPSAGIGIFSAIHSLITNKNLIGYSFSGEIFLTGGLGPVGGLHEKANAALRAGCHTMFVPCENDLSEEFIEEMNELGLKIKAISHVSELDYIFET